MQDHLDSHGQWTTGQDVDRPAAGVGMPTQSDPSQSAQVIFDDADAGDLYCHGQKERKTSSPRKLSAKWGVAQDYC